MVAFSTGQRSIKLQLWLLTWDGHMCGKFCQNHLNKIFFFFSIKWENVKLVKFHSLLSHLLGTTLVDFKLFFEAHERNVFLNILVLPTMMSFSRDANFGQFLHVLRGAAGEEVMQKQYCPLIIMCFYYKLFLPVSTHCRCTLIFKLICLHLIKHKFFDIFTSCPVWLASVFVYPNVC